MYTWLTGYRAQTEQKPRSRKGTLPMNEIPSPQPSLSCHNHLQPLPTQVGCSTDLHGGFKPLTWGSCQLPILFTLRNAHIIGFNVIWVAYLGKNLKYTLECTGAQNYMIPFWPIQSTPSVLDKTTWLVLNKHDKHFFSYRGPVFPRVRWFVMMKLSAWPFEKKDLGLRSQGNSQPQPADVRHGLGVLCLGLLQRLSPSAPTYYQSLVGLRKRDFST